jgi:hypothetical protein
MIKQFLSSGCSFSMVPATLKGINIENWPLHVENYLQVPSIHTGLASAGNSFISKSILYQLSQIENKNDLLVGVMWSGADRHMFYNRGRVFLPSESKTTIKYHKHMPVKISGEEAFYFLNPHTEHIYNKIYYSNFYDEIGSFIESMQHVLSLQWYLKYHKIKYFMTKFSDYAIPNSTIAQHPDLKYLYDMIDFSEWLPGLDMLNFCKDSGLPPVLPNDQHPSTEQSKLYTEQVIIPHLKNKGYVD